MLIYYYLINLTCTRLYSQQLFLILCLLYFVCLCRCWNINLPVHVQKIVSKYFNKLYSRLHNSSIVTKARNISLGILCPSSCILLSLFDIPAFTILFPPHCPKSFSSSNPSFISFVCSYHSFWSQLWKPEQISNTVLPSTHLHHISAIKSRSFYVSKDFNHKNQPVMTNSASYSLPISRKLNVPFSNLHEGSWARSSGMVYGPSSPINTDLFQS